MSFSRLFAARPVFEAETCSDFGSICAFIEIFLFKVQGELYVLFMRRHVTLNLGNQIGQFRSLETLVFFFNTQFTSKLFFYSRVNNNLTKFGQQKRAGREWVLGYVYTAKS